MPPSLLFQNVALEVCRAVVSSPSYRISGPQEGYRCKATYSLYPQFVSSPLTVESVNSICEAVARFRAEESQWTATHPKFFFEVCGKVSRRNEFFLKVVFQDEPTTVRAPMIMDSEDGSIVYQTLFDQWRFSGEARRFVQYMTNSFPSLVAIVAHVATGQKAGKADRYVPLLDDVTTITEFTPNGMSFLLSADSFCEVNHAMEDAMYEATVVFLRLREERPRVALFSGRDVNSVHRTFANFYLSATSVTSCPRVYGDTKLNNITDCAYVPKSDICCVIRRFCESNAFQATQNGMERHIILTAGRKGLHPLVCTGLVDLARDAALDDFLYISCNLISLARDVCILSEGFVIVQLRTFDFFPATEYVMTILHLKPLTPRQRGGSPGLLILPVGAPGVGKSMSGGQLQLFFNQARKYIVEKARGFTFYHVERDAVFKSAKDLGYTLKRARQYTHEILKEALSSDGTADRNLARAVVYLDSTNGSPDGRQEYASMWNSPLLVIHFDGLDATELLSRTMNRENHPSFPSDYDAQKRKIDVILQFLNQTENEVECTDLNHSVVHVNSSISEFDTFLQVCTNVVAHLILSPSLARVHAADAIRTLRSIWQ